MECDNKVKSSSSSTLPKWNGCSLIQFHLPPTTPVIILKFRLPVAELHTDKFYQFKVDRFSNSATTKLKLAEAGATEEIANKMETE